MKQVGTTAYKTTKQIHWLQNKRHDYITNYLHQASRTIVKLAEQYDVGKIIIGDIKGIKQQNQIKTFIQIPISQFTQVET